MTNYCKIKRDAKDKGRSRKRKVRVRQEAESRTILKDEKQLH